MSARPTVRLLSHTAFPLETLYIAAVSLDDPEVKFQKPEEIRMLLYTELAQHLKAEHKQFILDKMQELVNDENDPITDAIRFVFVIDGVTDKVFKELTTLNEKTYSPSPYTDFPSRLVWNTGLGEFVSTYRIKSPAFQNIKQLAIDAAATLLEVDPYLYQLITE